MPFKLFNIIAMLLFVFERKSYGEKPVSFWMSILYAFKAQLVSIDKDASVRALVNVLKCELFKSTTTKNNFKMNQRKKFKRSKRQEHAFTRTI